MKGLEGQTDQQGPGPSSEACKSTGWRVTNSTQAGARPRRLPGESGSELGLKGLSSKKAEGSGWTFENSAGLECHAEKEKLENSPVWESENLRKS